MIKEVLSDKVSYQVFGVDGMWTNILGLHCRRL